MSRHIRAVQMDIGSLAVTQLLVIHALTGCDTTSALYNQGKVSAFRKISGKKDSITLMDIISSDNPTQQQIHDAGSKLPSMILLWQCRPKAQCSEVLHIHDYVCLYFSKANTQEATINGEGCLLLLPKSSGIAMEDVN